MLRALDPLGSMEEADGPELYEEYSEEVLAEQDEVAGDGARVEMHVLRYLALARPAALHISVRCK